MINKREQRWLYLSDKVDFKLKILTKDKEGYYLTMKEPIHQEYNNHKYICTNIQATSM